MTKTYPKSIENQTRHNENGRKIFRKPPLKKTFTTCKFQTTQKQNLSLLLYLHFLLTLRLTVCVTRAGAGGGTPSNWENAKA
jgi:hypothetical protein